MARQKRDEAFDKPEGGSPRRQKADGAALWVAGAAAGLFLVALLTCGGGSVLLYRRAVQSAAAKQPDLAIRPEPAPVRPEPKPVVRPEPEPVVIRPQPTPPTKAPPAPDKPKVPAKHSPVLTVDAGVLSVNYGAGNDAVPAAKYEGKCIEVTGWAEYVRNEGGKTVVCFSTLGDPDNSTNVYCHMRPGQLAAIGAIKTEDIRAVTVIHGVCRGKRARAAFPGYAIDIDDCVLVRSGRP